MKNILLITIISVALVSCCNSKSVAQETINTSKDFDKTLVLNDEVTVSKGKLIGTTKPISKIDKVQEIEETPQIPAPPQTSTPPKTDSVIVKEEPKVVPPITAPPVQMNIIMHEAFNSLLQKHVNNAGNVNYNGFKGDRKALLEYISLLGENLPKEDWSKNEKLAYWMNAYNAMTIDLILRNQPLSSIKDIKKPWDQRLWKLGEKYYNLNEIEHQILRKMGDARIHFGINCASFSCPPLLNEAFVPAKVDRQLDKVARKFINDKSRNMIAADSVEISKIFNWFAKDFKTNGSIIDYLNLFSTVTISKNAKVKYMDYDWALNK